MCPPRSPAFSQPSVSTNARWSPNVKTSTPRTLAAGCHLSLNPCRKLLSRRDRDKLCERPVTSMLRSPGQGWPRVRVETKFVDHARDRVVTGRSLGGQWLFYEANSPTCRILADLNTLVHLRLKMLASWLAAANKLRGWPLCFLYAHCLSSPGSYGMPSCLGCERQSGGLALAASEDCHDPGHASHDCTDRTGDFKRLNSARSCATSTCPPAVVYFSVSLSLLDKCQVGQIALRLALCHPTTAET